MDRPHAVVEESRAIEFAEDGGNPTGPVHVLDEIFPVRRDLRQARGRPGNPVDVVEGEVEVGLVRRGERCRIVLEEPPIAMSIAMALPNAARLAMARGSTPSSPSS